VAQSGELELGELDELDKLDKLDSGLQCIV
jgi:hypothetical protein